MPFQLKLDKGNYPENSHVVFCPNKLRSIELFHVFGSCFRKIAVILVSEFLIFPKLDDCVSCPCTNKIEETDYTLVIHKIMYVSLFLIQRKGATCF